MYIVLDIINDCFIGHTFLPTKLNGTCNGIFIDRSFARIASRYSDAWNEMWFQHYGRPARFPYGCPQLNFMLLLQGNGLGVLGQSDDHPDI